MRLSRQDVRKPVRGMPSSTSGWVLCRFVTIDIGVLIFDFGLTNYFPLLLLAPLYTEPCNPSPCGPYSQCRAVNGQAVCSCVPGYVGSPPACRPECTVNSDCGRNEACSNQKCRDPCPGSCGVGARCEVVNHNPICSCPPRYTGDPFTRCRPIRKHFDRICKFHASAI